MALEEARATNRSARLNLGTSTSCEDLRVGLPPDRCSRDIGEATAGERGDELLPASEQLALAERVQAQVLAATGEGVLDLLHLEQTRGSTSGPPTEPPRRAGPSGSERARPRLLVNGVYKPGTIGHARAAGRSIDRQL